VHVCQYDAGLVLTFFKVKDIIHIMKTTPAMKDIQNAIKRGAGSKNIHAYLFGSRAAGTNHPNSDWDIAITCDSGLRGYEIEKIRDELDALPTLHSFDVVDFNSVTEDFKKISLQCCRVIL